MADKDKKTKSLEAREQALSRLKMAAWIFKLTLPNFVNSYNF